jgi:cytochrome c-type biogenesis protein CcmE
MTVSYRGLLPDLFREGQGVVAEGVLETPDRMRADTILAKHDERYMPRDVADKLKKQGLWREDQAKLPSTGASASADTPPLR